MCSGGPSILRPVPGGSWSTYSQQWPGAHPEDGCKQQSHLNTRVPGSALSKPRCPQRGPRGTWERAQRHQTPFKGSAQWRMPAPSRGRTTSINSTCRHTDPPFPPDHHHHHVHKWGLGVIKKKSRVAPRMGIMLFHSLL